MKAVFKNIFLVAVVLIFSWASSMKAGYFYSSSVGGLNGTWVGGSGTWESIIGFPFAYIFFVVLLFKVFGEGNKKKLILWLLLPAGLFFAAGDLKHIYLPVALGLVAWILAKVVQTILVRIKLR